MIVSHEIRQCIIGPQINRFRDFSFTPPPPPPLLHFWQLTVTDRYKWTVWYNKKWQLMGHLSCLEKKKERKKKAGAWFLLAQEINDKQIICVRQVFGGKKRCWKQEITALIIDINNYVSTFIFYGEPFYMCVCNCICSSIVESLALTVAWINRLKQCHYCSTCRGYQRTANWVLIHCTNEFIS